MMQVKHIGIYLERKPESGGAYQYCLAMLKALSQFPEDRYAITAFIMYEEWRPIVENLGIKAVYAQKNLPEKVLYHMAEVCLPVSICRKLSRLLHPFARHLKKQGIDYCIYPCADKISFMMQTPAVVTVFDLMHRYLTDFPEIADPTVFKSRERSYTNIARYAKMILVDSEVGKQQMVECYAKTGGDTLSERIFSLPYIAPDYVYESTEKETLSLSGVFEKYIFYPAQFWKHKNHENLLRAAAKLKKQGVNINLVFSGTGKNGYEEVMELIEELNLKEQVLVLGYVSNEEVVALYRHARALVMPTYGGPTNIPQLEAFVLGCPVATSRIFGIPEQVGDAALLFDPANVDEIAACIERLWTEDALCECLRTVGYEKAKSWGQEQFKERLLQYLDRL